MSTFSDVKLRAAQNVLGEWCVYRVNEMGDNVDRWFCGPFKQDMAREIARRWNRGPVPEGKGRVQ